MNRADCVPGIGLSSPYYPKLGRGKRLVKAPRLARQPRLLLPLRFPKTGQTLPDIPNVSSLPIMRSINGLAIPARAGRASAWKVGVAMQRQVWTLILVS